MGVVIKRNVILRSIVTDRLKEQLKEELQRSIEEIDQRIQQIDFRTQPYITELQRSNIQQAMAVRQQVNQEKEKQRSVREVLLGRIKQVEELELGEEIIRGTLESQVEVEEGDNLKSLAVRRSSPKMTWWSRFASARWAKRRTLPRLSQLEPHG